MLSRCIMPPFWHEVSTSQAKMAITPSKRLGLLFRWYRQSIFEIIWRSSRLALSPGRSTIRSDGSSRSQRKIRWFFLEETRIGVDWELSQRVWRLAGRAFQDYAERRQRQRDRGTRRILADFIIGAHTFTNGFCLLTLDERLYRAAFPNLIIETF